MMKTPPLLRIFMGALLAVLFFLSTWAQAPRFPSPLNLLAVPIFTQATDYSCGAASLLAVLNYWKSYEGNEFNLQKELGTSSKDGTHPLNILSVARAHGLNAELRENMDLADLEILVRKGATVILDYQAWPEASLSLGAKTTQWEEVWDSGHYSVLVGIDITNVYMMDPSTHNSYGFIKRGEFLKRWHDFEDNGGRPKKYLRLGIVISGREHLMAYPATPSEIN